MRSRLSAAIAATAMILTIAGFASALPGPGGLLPRPTPCPSTGCPTPNPSATPRPKPTVVGITPSPSISLVPIDGGWGLLPDTSTR